MSLNVITVWTGERYGIEYVQKMRSMLERHLQMDMDFYCITDRSEEIDWIKIRPPEVLDGWWNKLLLFSDPIQGIVPEGHILYLDLDLIILSNITEIVERCFHKGFLSLHSDRINYGGTKFNSSFMSFQSGLYFELWDDFWKDYESIQKNFEGGDQVWIGKWFDDHKSEGIKPYYLDGEFGSFIHSYKWGYLKDGLTENTKIVDFHGIPKMHNLKTPLITEHWN